MGKTHPLQPAHFYYFGRRSYPEILYAVVLVLIVMVSTVFSLLVVKSWERTIDEQTRAIVDREFLVKRIRQGTNYENAVKALDTFMTSSALNAYEIFDREMDVAGYTHAQRFRIRELKREGANRDRLVQLLVDYQLEGLLNKISRAEKLHEFYKRFMDGGDEPLDKILQSRNDIERLIPPEVLEVTRVENEKLSEGAKGLLQEKLDLIRNLVGQVDDRNASLGESVSKVGEEHKELNSSFSSLKGELLEKRGTYSDTLWTKMDEQKLQWDKFMKLTKEHIDSVSERQVTLLSLEQQKAALSKILLARAVDESWRPPLDLIDGKVLSTETKLGFAVIDIGREQGLRLGQGFDVFRMSGEVRQANKARLIVHDLSEQVSICKIVDGNFENPIEIGDSVSNSKFDNPYDRKVRPRYALRGRFDGEPSQALTEILIEESGGLVVAELNEVTDFVVAGDYIRNEVLQESKRLGILVIRAKDLLQHLGISEKTLYRYNEAFTRQRNLAGPTQ